ncbi:hypothetical protein [Streptomyces sp. t39]|uniref:hypothetical protein n=1 Tax=Streptomyces sp. t39 TaxID=1828156 RepID=UPI0011CE0CC8|nr:hypothetical protein [Streptomyces sp. t39]TXS48238.1 hypothetical protein EAO77_31170 [Streptomyces sp. t39]
MQGAVTHRRWWVERWADGVACVTGLVAEGVQVALLEGTVAAAVPGLRSGRPARPEGRTARSLCEDALGAGHQLDRVHDLPVGEVLDGTAGAAAVVLLP